MIQAGSVGISLHGLPGKRERVKQSPQVIQPLSSYKLLGASTEPEGVRPFKQ